MLSVELGPKNIMMNKVTPILKNLQVQGEEADILQ